VITIRNMTVADLCLGLRLTRQAGWNQTEADWARLIDMQPDGGFVAEWAGTPAGTVTTCLLGDVAWVAMVLVDESWRGRGMGRALMERALVFLDRHGVRTVRLDATPFGQALYESLGFVGEYRLARYQGRLAKADGTQCIRPLPPDGMDALLTLDRVVTGTDRGRLLRRLADERPEALRVVVRDGRVDGYLMARPGARARQIGPCIAGPESGPVLLAEAIQTYAGESVLIDVPDDHAASRALVDAAGLTVQRHLLRMCRGEPLVEDRGGLWASAGPEKG
jgi:GNAT superfamily N-acetyltransferase